MTREQQPGKLNILYIPSRLPTRLDTGDRFRPYKFIQGLAAAGHCIDLVGFAEGGSEPRPDPYPDPYPDLYAMCRTVVSIPFTDIEFQRQGRLKQIGDMIRGQMHGYPRRVWQFHSPALAGQVARMVEQQPYDVIHFSEIGVAELLSSVPRRPHQAWVYDLIDAVSLSVHSSLRHRLDGTWPVRFIEQKQLAAFERSVIKQVDAAILISPRDAAFLGNPPHTTVIPNGVDLPPLPDAAARDLDILFLGNLSARANRDAVLWFARAVMPHVWRRLPAARFYIVGREPDAEVQSLAGERVVVTGGVPDAAAYLGRAKVAVAPLRIGAGLKTKVLEYLASAAATVATAEANVGIDAPDGQAIWIADAPQQQAARIVELLENALLRESIGQGGRDFVRRHFSWEKALAALEAVYERALHP